MIIGVLLALGAAASNAIGTVLQRKAARSVPSEATMRFALIQTLAHRPVWLAGVGGLIGGFVCQASALHFAELALVQPIVVFELPLTVLLAAWVFHRMLDRHAVIGTVAISAGVGMLLMAITPHRGHGPTTTGWSVATAVTIAVGVALSACALRATGSSRAALFGVAAGLGFGFTAALMNGAVQALNQGVAALVSSWQLYAMALAGIGSLFLTQNALQAGPIVAAQPAITVTDPLVSVAYGVLLFDERLRGGPWLALVIAGALIAAAGVVLVSRSPLLDTTSSEEFAPDRR